MTEAWSGEILGYAWTVRKRPVLLMLDACSHDLAAWTEDVAVTEHERTRRRTLMYAAAAAYAQAAGASGDVRAARVALDVETDGPLFVFGEVRGGHDYVVTFGSIKEG